MAQITKPYTFIGGGDIKASEFNSNYDTIYNEFNGNIDKDNIKSGAGIEASKLDLSSMPVVGSSSANSASFTNVTVDNLSAVTDIFTVPFTDYSSTSSTSGWSVLTTKKIFYKKLGKTIIVTYNLQGTSNSGVGTFSLPYTASNNLNFFNSCVVEDNGKAQTSSGYAIIDLNTSILRSYKDGANTTFTSSGEKSINGFIIFETN